MRLEVVPVASIKENPVALRSVDKETEDYVQLVDSIREKGVLNPILLAEKKDEQTGATYLVIIDGLHRYTAACDAGLTEVPAKIETMDDSSIMESQLVANLHKIETKPVQYSKQLKLIFTMNPFMSMSDMARKLSVSPTWLNDRLGLLKLAPEAQKLVDSDEIKLANAYALAKLPANEQLNFLDRAMTQEATEFAGAVSARVREIKAAAVTGQDAGAEKFTPSVYMQKYGEVKAVFEDPTPLAALVQRENATTAVEGAIAAIKWVMHQDSASIEAAKAKYEQAQKEKAEAAERRAKEKATAKAKKAAELAAKAQEEANAAQAALGTPAQG